MNSSNLSKNERKDKRLSKKPFSSRNFSNLSEARKDNAGVYENIRQGGPKLKVSAGNAASRAKLVRALSISRGFAVGSETTQPQPNLRNCSRKEAFRTVSNTLFVSDKSERFHLEDAVRSLKKIGVKKGDILMVHSDVSTFGKFDITSIPKRKVFLDKMAEALKLVVGKGGTIMMPTYSYNFWRGNTFDVQKTPSETGTLTEHFRKTLGVKRTYDPNLSFAVWGKEKGFFTTGLSKDSYGHNSVFGKLRQKRGKILFFGAPFQSTTFVHYVEASYGVPYRYVKIYTGKIKDGKRVYQDTYEHPMRMQDHHVIFDGPKLEKEFRKRRLFQEGKLGNGNLLLINANDYFRAGIDILKKNINFFLQKEFYTKRNKYIVPSKSEFPPRGSRTSSEIFLKGLDKKETVFIADKSTSSIGRSLAQILSKMPVQLKYSYRFVFNSISRSSISGRREVGLRSEKSINYYMDLIYLIEHDGVFVGQSKSFFPRFRGIGWKSWLSRQKFNTEYKNVLDKVHNMSNGKKTLSAISKKLGVDFRIARKVVEDMFAAGFIKEIAK